jgi:purine nucleosidase
MSTPVLIDTDMGVDDAMAVGLALASSELDVVGLASVGGNVSLDQATLNMGRLFNAFEVSKWPNMARGLDQPTDLQDATHVHGDDGLGLVDLPDPQAFTPGELIPLYEELIAAHGESLVIVAIGPLTNLAHLLGQRPGLLQRAGRILVMGGAIWCKGNITPHAEFNFYRDPIAAREVLTSGLPITVVSLDVTNQVVMDESHVARLSRSNNAVGERLAAMIRYPMAQAGTDEGAGRFLVHDPLTVGTLLWPELFLRSKMALDITTSGPQAGKTKPVIAKDKTRQLSVVISVNVDGFMENLMERLCREKFVV